MKLAIHLEENETSEDITTVSLTHALYKFVDEHNKHACMDTIQEFKRFIFMRDIADIIMVMEESQDNFYKLQEQCNE